MDPEMTSLDSAPPETFGGSDPPSAPLTFRAPPVSNCARSIIDRKLRKFASETSFVTETASESSLEREVPSRTRVFTVRPVTKINGGALRRKRHDSDASGSAGSDLTVASGAATPRRLRRPKSSGEMHTSLTSATIHSLESAAAGVTEARRPSHVYMMDDDSVHEFEDDDGEYFCLKLDKKREVNSPSRGKI